MLTRDERCRDERGSVALVVMIIFVMASLAAIMVTRNAGDLRLVVTEQQQASADAAADLGVARALARVQNGEPQREFVDEGSVGDATWSVTARMVDATDWQVVATGAAGTTRRSFGATLNQRGDQFWVVANWHQIAAETTSQTLLQQQQDLLRRKRQRLIDRRNLFRRGEKKLSTNDQDLQQLLTLLR